MDIKYIEPFQEWHYEAMKDIIHEGNVREAWALLHLSGAEALRKSIDLSDKVWTGIKGDVPAAIFGLIEPKTLLDETGIGWLICSEMIEKHAISFLKGFKKAIPYMFENCEVIRNYIDSRNLAVLKMVGWVGFTIHPPQIMGKEQLPFHRIELKRGDCKCV